MPNLLKKFVFAFFAFLILFGSIAPNFLIARAAPNPPPPTPISTGLDAAPSGTWYNQGFFDWFNRVYAPGSENEIFGERYTAAQVQWVIYGLFAFILNSTGNAEVLTCVVSHGANLSECRDAISKLVSYSGSDANTAVAQQNKSLLSLIFADRPLSGISYFREKIKNFKLVPEAHAQTVGFGFSALDTVKDMWSSFRDIAFGLFVLAAVVFAFMIMFRVKIDPQTVITVQSAIPKIALSLILVTFSYAIAGFLIDFMYVVIGLISVLMAPLIPKADLLGIIHLQPLDPYPVADVFQLLTIGPVQPATSTTAASAGGIFGLLQFYIAPLMAVFTIGLVLSLIVAAIPSPASPFGVFFTVLFLILMVVIVVISLWVGIKTIWALTKAFANILLLTIFAPIQLALGILIPNFGFGQWIRSYISHLSTFVVTGVLALFAWIFMLMAWNQMFTGATLTLASNGVTSSPWPPLLGSGGAANLLFAGVSFVLFTMIPKAADLVQSFLAGKPFAYGTAIGEALAPVGFAYKASGGEMATQMVREMGAAAALYKYAGKRGPLYKVMKTINPNWDAALGRIERTGGMDTT